MKVELSSYEIGSIAKPEWRVKAISNKPITKDDIDNARAWGKRLDLEHEPLSELLEHAKSKPLDDNDKHQIKQWASQYVIRMFEKCGLDYVYDGEQQRSEMYHYPITHAEGFTFRGHVRSFDNKYYKKAACVAPPKVANPFHVEEFKFAKSVAVNKLKVPITGAYTLGEWSFDEYYAGKSQQIGSKAGKEQQRSARREFILAIAKNIIRPNLEALIEAGSDCIQIDEPAVTTQPDELPLFIESFNESVKGLNARFIIHICFSDYDLLFPHMEALENCWGVCLGFANLDTKDLGVDGNSRQGYKILKKFAALPNKLHIGVGVLDIHTDYIEPVDLIRDRILYAMEVLGPDYVNPCPDCGLRTRDWDVTYRKLSNMKEAINSIR